MIKEKYLSNDDVLAFNVVLMLVDKMGIDKTKALVKIISRDITEPGTWIQFWEDAFDQDLLIGLSELHAIDFAWSNSSMMCEHVDSDGIPMENQIPEFCKINTLLIKVNYDAIDFIIHGVVNRSNPSPEVM